MAFRIGAALVLYALFTLALGYDITLQQMTMVLFCSFLPRLFKYVISIIPLLVDSSAREHFLPSNPIPTNPEYFLADAGFSRKTLVGLTGLDLFTFWSLALVALGISTVRRRSFATTAAVVALCWAVSLLLAILMQ